MGEAGIHDISLRDGLREEGEEGGEVGGRGEFSGALLAEDVFYGGENDGNLHQMLVGGAMEMVGLR